MNKNFFTFCPKATSLSFSIFYLLNLSIPHANAQPQTLPDEINYPRFEILMNDAYDRLADSTDQYNAAKNATDTQAKKISDTEININNIQQDFRNAQNEFNQRSSELGQSQNNYASVDQSLRSEIQQLNQETSLLNRIDRDYRELTKIFEPLDQTYRNQRVRQEELMREAAVKALSIKQRREALDYLEARYNRVDQDVEESRLKVVRLKAQKATWSQEEESLSVTIQKEKSDIDSLQNVVDELQNSFRRLDAHINTVATKLETARQNGATKEEIQQLEQLLTSAKKDRADAQQSYDLKNSKLSSLKSSLAAHESSLTSIQSKISQATRSIDEETSTQTALIQSKAELQNKIALAKKELTILVSEQADAERRLNSFNRQFANTENEWRQLRAQIEIKSREYDQQVVRYNSSLARRQSLERDLGNLAQQIQQTQNRLAQLDQILRSGDANLRNLQAQLSQLKSDLIVFQRKEAEALATYKSDQVTYEGAKKEYGQRLELYRNYESAAQAIGASEVGTAAQDAGAKNGESRGKDYSTINGSNIGSDLGNAQGKFWAQARGEGQGYSVGFNSGTSAPADLNRAQAEGSAAGTAAAKKYLEQVLRPKYFAQFLDDLISLSQVGTNKEGGASIDKSRATVIKDQNEKSFINESASNFKVSQSQDPSPLTDDEWLLSQKIKTSLDEVIAKSYQEFKAVDDKSKKFADYRTVFTSPTNIPSGKPKCQNVYKDLTVFKDICAKKYQDNFANLYKQSFEGNFAKIYNENYKTLLASASLRVRGLSYDKAFKPSFDLAKGEGYKAGVEQTYQQAVRGYYETAYATTLENEDGPLQNKIKEEVAQYAQKNPVLGFSKAGLDQTQYLPGSKGNLKIQIKNISPVDFNGPLSFRITGAQNIVLQSSQGSLMAAARSSTTSFSDVAYEISRQARSGDPLLINGEIDFPGDTYRSVRTLKFQVSGTLGVNAVANLKLDYDNTPKVKKFLFGFKKHTFKVTLSPKAESVSDGYLVKLTPVNESSALIQMEKKEVSTGALGVGESKEVAFQYKFPKNARGKKLNLKFELTTRGVVIDQKNIEISPR
ncbi:MAG: hypothetical protein QE271_10295 [Bacteriovoracaceae bacterium]|nr:hypothetical protein [Bacteriovoracaceae bacterium]